MSDHACINPDCPICAVRSYSKPQLRRIAAQVAADGEDSSPAATDATVPACPVCGESSYQVFMAGDGELGLRAVDHIGCVRKLACCGNCAASHDVDGIYMELCKHGGHAPDLELEPSESCEFTPSRWERLP